MCTITISPTLILVVCPNLNWSKSYPYLIFYGKNCWIIQFSSLNSGKKSAVFILYIITFGNCMGFFLSINQSPNKKFDYLPVNFSLVVLCIICYQRFMSTPIFIGFHVCTCAPKCCFCVVTVGTSVMTPDMKTS